MKKIKGKRGFGRPTKLGKFVGRDDPLALARKLEAEVKADRLREFEKTCTIDPELQRQLYEDFGGVGSCSRCWKREDEGEG